MMIREILWITVNFYIKIESILMSTHYCYQFTSERSVFGSLRSKTLLSIEFFKLKKVELMRLSHWLQINYILKIKNRITKINNQKRKQRSITFILRLVKKFKVHTFVSWLKFILHLVILLPFIIKVKITLYNLRRGTKS